MFAGKLKSETVLNQETDQKLYHVWLLISRVQLVWVLIMLFSLLTNLLKPIVWAWVKIFNSAEFVLVNNVVFLFSLIANAWYPKALVRLRDNKKLDFSEDSLEIKFKDNVILSIKAQSFW